MPHHRGSLHHELPSEAMAMDTHIRLSDRLTEALKLYAADQDLRNAAALRVLLEEILKKKGYLTARSKRLKR